MEKERSQDVCLTARSGRPPSPPSAALVSLSQSPSQSAASDDQQTNEQLNGNGS